MSTIYAIGLCKYKQIGSYWLFMKETGKWKVFKLSSYLQTCVFTLQHDDATHFAASSSLTKMTD